VQLHVVQEMLEFLQADEQLYYECTDAVDIPPQQLMCVSAAATGQEEAEQTLQIVIELQGVTLSVLIDSGSTHSFVNASLMSKFQGVTAIRPVPVKIANGALIYCTRQLSSAAWSTGGNTFHSNFRFLPLGCYDAIIGMDWLVQHSPMEVDWLQKWMKVPHLGKRALITGICSGSVAYTLVELNAILSEEPLPVHTDVQPVLEEFASVFATPCGLPPRRTSDHFIPLIPGARPISIRPYRVVPELKTEIEKQIAELLAQGVIQASNSPFSSPVLLVRKKDLTWRMVVDYRHLNALTIKGKYPLPIIDELLDELAGSCYFSKLDLRAGYHQIRLAPGEEFKTAFQTHNGHYEFKVMAFGLSGAPGTFQSAMNTTLAPVLRKCALVFF
jgi:hypothetical protein